MTIREPGRRSFRSGALLLTAALSPAAVLAPAAAQAQPEATAVVTLYATGLNNPRGLKFGPDGDLYVAEGGIGGTTPPPDDPDCVVVPPVGPYAGSTDGARISKIDAFGNRTTVVDGLPSSQTSPDLGSFVSGVADVAFIDDTLYAILAGAGCSHGVPEVPNSVIRVNDDGSWDVVADLGAYQRAHPVETIEEDDFEPDGTWYSMLAVRGNLYAVEPNHGEIVKITPDGKVSRVVDISASEGHVVPTALAYHGNFYVANLGEFPQDEGSSRVWRVTPSGEIHRKATGFNMVLGLVFDQRNRMYVLETSAAPAPTGGTGRILRVNPSGKSPDVIADNLFFPTGMTIGPDGNLYVSHVGFGPPPIGLGQILKIEVTD
ncbi:MAG TPA: ScyD/ScyE family protein [Gammaproteobacteria bacterium]|nr:ScyD/ScyE family protein [Gammaproteobacteria bacterium]